MVPGGEGILRPVQPENNTPPGGPGYPRSGGGADPYPAPSDPGAPRAWPACVWHTALCPRGAGCIEVAALESPSGFPLRTVTWFGPDPPYMVDATPVHAHSAVQFNGGGYEHAPPSLRRQDPGRLLHLPRGQGQGQGRGPSGMAQQSTGRVAEPPAPSAAVTSCGLWGPGASWEL